MPSPRKLQLIVNADDFGVSEDTVAATIECFEAGALTSATLMPGMPATERAMAFALEHPEFSYGVHLSFVRDPSHLPLCAPGLVPSLVGSDAKLLTTRQARLKSLSGRLVVEEIEREIDAQVRTVLDYGVPVSHVDSHRHMHKFAPFRAALARTLPRLGISRVRTVQDIYLTRPLRSPTYWLGRYWRARIVRLFETTEHMFMPSRDDPPWAERLLRTVRGLQAGSLEVGIHPGRSEIWLDRDRRAAIEFAEAVRDDATLVDWRSLAPVGGTHR